MQMEGREEKVGQGEDSARCEQAAKQRRRVRKRPHPCSQLGHALEGQACRREVLVFLQSKKKTKIQLDEVFIIELFKIKSGYAHPSKSLVRKAAPATLRGKACRRIQRQKCL